MGMGKDNKYILMVSPHQNPKGKNHEISGSGLDCEVALNLCWMHTEQYSAGGSGLDITVLST